MTMNRMWCSACNVAVEAVVETGISHIVVPAVGTSIGGMIGAASGDHKDNAPGRAVVGGLVGALLGVIGHAIVREAVPAAQKLVCGNCGCEHLSHAA